MDDGGPGFIPPEMPGGAGELFYLICLVIMIGICAIPIVSIFTAR